VRVPQILGQNRRDGSGLNFPVLLGRSMVALGVVFYTSITVSEHVIPHSHEERLTLNLIVFMTVGAAVSYFMVTRPAMRADAQRRRELLDQQRLLLDQAKQHDFAAGLQDGFDMSETEQDAHDLVARILPDVHGGPAELLLADSSRAHLSRVAVSPAGTPGCSVRTPSQCPAVRRGHSVAFPDSAGVSSCPRLAERGPGHSALCVPVMILGAPMGVLHLTGPAETLRPGQHHERVESLAVQSGSRIGALRATASSQLAATTDPLTGLLNRRSMTDRLQELAASGRSFAVAFADLDSFKALNDTFGHATGDHALRLFARALKATTRESELVCRYGGEEFLVVLPDCGVDEAAPVVHRIRDELRAMTVLSGSGTPVFTASFGLADSTYAADPLDVITLADQALLQAKQEGKDRLIITDRPDAKLNSLVD
jgi:diguanylate cyclase (GGDEF)-like protein